MTAKRLELSVAATPRNVRTVRQEIADIAASVGMSKRRIDDLRLCVNEAMANAVAHAYGEGSGPVDVVVEADDQYVHVALRDYGEGISPTPRSARNGFGLRLMEALSQRCTVASARGGGTEVRMTFPLRSCEPRAV